MPVSEKTIRQQARAKQGGGGAFPEPKPDRTHRVLNYPGLEYLWERLKREGIGNGGGAEDIDALSDPEVRRILGGWEEGELDDGWNARAANKLATARQIALSGDVSGDAMFDGSEDVVIGTAVECLTTTEIDDLMAQSMTIGG